MVSAGLLLFGRIFRIDGQRCDGALHLLCTDCDVVK